MSSRLGPARPHKGSVSRPGLPKLRRQRGQNRAVPAPRGDSPTLWWFAASLWAACVIGKPDSYQYHQYPSDHRRIPSGFTRPRSSAIAERDTLFKAKTVTVPGGGPAHAIGVLERRRGFTSGCKPATASLIKIHPPNEDQCHGRVLERAPPPTELKDLFQSSRTYAADSVATIARQGLTGTLMPGPGYRPGRHARDRTEPDARAHLVYADYLWEFLWIFRPIALSSRCRP